MSPSTLVRPVVCAVPVLASVALAIRPGHVLPADALLHLAYLVWTVLLPGAFLWAWCDPRSADRPRWEGVALGAGLGLAVCVLVGAAGARLGAPWLPLAWPVPVLAVATVVRRRRPPSPGRRAAPSWSAELAAVGISLVVLALLARERLSVFRADQPGALRERDETFALSLTTEMMHHPTAPQFPYVAGTPLEYHWGVFAHLANAATATGTEPSVLVRTLGPLAFTMLLMYGVRAAASRWWGDGAGVLALTLVGLGSLPDVFGWSRHAAPLLGELVPLREGFASPSQGMALVLVMPTLVLLQVVLTSARGPRLAGGAVAVVALLAVSVLVKASLPPLFLAGLAGAVLVGLATRTGRARTALAAIGGLAVIVPMGLLVYGSGARTLAISPLHGAVRSTVSLTGLDVADRPPGELLSVLGVGVVLLLAVPLLPVLVLRKDPTSWCATGLLAGFWAGGCLAWLLTGHVYGAEDYFLHTAGLAAACLLAGGVALAVRGQGRNSALSAVAALAIGVVVVEMGGRITARATGPLPTTAPSELAWALILPPSCLWAGLVALLLVGARYSAARALAVSVAVAACLAGAVVPLGLADRPTGPPDVTDAIGARGVEAARWLRAHSSPGDVVATNAHCYRPTESPCQAQAFWISGFAERRVLVEGWAYLPRATSLFPPDGRPEADTDTLPFSDQALLRLNDSAFTSPTAAGHAPLAHDHGVRWLVVDLRFPADPAGLERLGTVVHREGDYLVVRVG